MSNEDNLEKAIDHLNGFTHNWCMNVAETEKQDDLVFRCKECEFSTNSGSCLLKVFRHNKMPDYKDFGCMGDL